ncbi:MAG TPA: hypothetical protein VK776_13900 [Bryobacteraceae bacterium]|nr:hypothetical protein [Bryobacteraceae bacterium]
MNPKSAKDTPPVATPITINAQGVAVPGSATISISANGGADFNASYACSLSFTNPPGCPFENCSNDTLSLSQGHNTEDFSSGATSGTKYTYTISDPLGQNRITTAQYDITVSS